MRGKNKKWITPVLIVLVRGKPEESCLLGCKLGTPLYGGPGAEYWPCATPGPYHCPFCNAFLSS
jgi:hypothetical protein